MMEYKHQLILSLITLMMQIMPTMNYPCLIFASRLLYTQISIAAKNKQLIVGQCPFDIFYTQAYLPCRCKAKIRVPPVISELAVDEHDYINAYLWSITMMIMTSEEMIELAGLIRVTNTTNTRQAQNSILMVYLSSIYMNFQARNIVKENVMIKSISATVDWCFRLCKQVSPTDHAKSTKYKLTNEAHKYPNPRVNQLFQMLPIFNLRCTQMLNTTTKYLRFLKSRQQLNPDAFRVNATTFMKARYSRLSDSRKLNEYSMPMARSTKLGMLLICKQFIIQSNTIIIIQQAHQQYLMIVANRDTTTMLVQIQIRKPKTR